MTRQSKGTKVARWMHLLEALLGRRTGLTLEGIIDEVPGYAIPDALRHGTSAEATRAKNAVRRTFERDKDELRALGIPLQITHEEGEEYVYSLRRSEFYLPYLDLVDQHGVRPRSPKRARGDEYGKLSVHALTPDVLAAIVEGALRAAEVGDARLSAAAADALRTLSLDLPVDTLRQELGRNHAAPASSDPAVLDVIDDAVATRKALVLQYRGMRDAEPRERTVHPLGLFLAGNTWYLAARDADGAADAEAPVKNFRVSRVMSATAKGPAGVFASTNVFDLAAHARSRQAWELGDGEALEVDVHFSGELGAVRAAAEQGDPIDGDASRRRFRVRRPDAFIRWIVSFAPHARVTAPEPLVAAMRQHAGETRQHHAGVSA